MDPVSETRTFKWILRAFLAFALSAYFSCMEMKYALVGHTAPATIRSVTTTFSHEDTGPSEERWLVEFVYLDKDGKRQVEQESLKMTPAGRPAVGQTLQVEYLSGALDSARPVGHRAYGQLAIFFLSLAILTFFILKLAFEAAAYNRECRHRRAREGSARPYRF